MTMARKLKLSSSRRAEMGVGTLIVFVSIILIAAIASSVLIENTDLMRDRTDGTGRSAMEGVSSIMSVDSVMGLITNDDQLDQINIYLRLGAGSPSIDLSKMSIVLTAQHSGGSVYRSLVMDKSIGEETFTAEWIQEKRADSFLDQGEFVKVQIGQNGSTELNLEKGCTVTIVLMPQNGVMTTMEMNAPENQPRGFFDMRR